MNSNLTHGNSKLTNYNIILLSITNYIYTCSVVGLTSGIGLETLFLVEQAAIVLIRTQTKHIR